MKNLPFLLLSIAFLVGGMLMNYQIIRYSNAYKSMKEDYAAQLNFEKRLLNIDEWFSEEEQTSWEEAKPLLDKANSYYDFAERFAIYFSLLAIAYLAVIFLFFRRNVITIKGFAIGLIITAFLSLYVGLFSPMIEIGAFERNMTIPMEFKTKAFALSLDYTQVFEGDMYFYYQSKSVVELIGLLLKQNNFVVGISILLFSILIPVLKLSLATLALIRPAILDNRFVNLFIHKSGKWSMADVFVVAMFLAFLAFNNMQTGITTVSEVRVGLYFFLAYCLLSIGLTYFLGRNAESAESSVQMV